MDKIYLNLFQTVDLQPIAYDGIRKVSNWGIFVESGLQENFVWFEQLFVMCKSI